MPWMNGGTGIVILVTTSTTRDGRVSGRTGIVILVNELRFPGWMGGRVSPFVMDVDGLDQRAAGGCPS